MKSIPCASTDSFLHTALLAARRIDFYAEMERAEQSSDIEKEFVLSGTDDKAERGARPSLASLVSGWYLFISLFCASALPCDAVRYRRSRLPRIRALSL